MELEWNDKLCDPSGATLTIQVHAINFQNGNNNLSKDKIKKTFQKDQIIFLDNHYFILNKADKSKSDNEKSNFLVVQNDRTFKDQKELLFSVHFMSLKN